MYVKEKKWKMEGKKVCLREEKIERIKESRVGRRKKRKSKAVLTDQPLKQ